MAKKIIGNTTATPNPRPDWAQTDASKADYIKNKPIIPTKTSELTNDSGFKTTDNNTTYSLSKSGTEITLTGSDGSTTSVAASDVDTINSVVSSHNTETSAHNDIRDLITGLTTRLNTLADSDDTTLDQMSEVVAYIKSNKELIEAVTTDKVNVSDIVDNLTTNVANKPLSAAQGVAIKALIDAITVPTKVSELTNDKGYVTADAEVANAKKLATARTIALSQGATGTATSFDGSSNISIPVTNIKESYVSWGGKTVTGGSTPFDDIAIGSVTNCFAFLPLEGVTAEYSRDGGDTWTSASVSSGLFVPSVGGGQVRLDAPYTTSDKIRITIDNSVARHSCTLKKILLRLYGIGVSCSAIIEHFNGENLQASKTEVIATGWNSVPVNYSFYLTYKLRITLGITQIEEHNNPGFALEKIVGLGQPISGSTMAKSGHLYNYDANQNATFPAKVAAPEFVEGGTTLNKKYAGISHNHDNTYAPKEHTHDEYGSTYVHPDTHPASMITGLATVATSGKYDDLIGKLALGETSSTAYYGDKGRAAYEHSLKISGNPHKVTKEDIKLENVDNVKQYSAENPPPYPVTSVNGQTGSVVIDIGAAIPESLPNPNPLVINGTSYDGSESVVVDIGLEPLIGTTAQVAPAQVVEALHRGRTIILTATVADLGNVTFNHFLYWDDFDAVFSTAVVKYGEELKSVEIRGNLGGSWVVHTSDVAQKTELPTALKNPNAITFTGAVAETYDGSEAKTINIPMLVTPNMAANEGEDGYIANRTHYVDEDGNVHKLSNKFIDAEWLATKGASGGEVLFSSDIQMTGATVSLSEHGNSFNVVEGDEYDIYWNDTLYRCSAKKYDGEYYIGNGSLALSGAPNSGEPFCLYGNFLSPNTINYIKKDTDVSETISLKVTTKGLDSYNKMPAEYLPDCVVKSINGIDPDENGNVTVEVGVDPETLDEAVEAALEEAKASGRFDGEDGVSPTVSVSKSGKVTTVAITDKNGTKTATINDGEDGATGKTAYAYAQDGGYAGTEAEFAEKLAKEPLIGTTTEITPTMVAEAVAEGRPVAIEHTDETFGEMVFNYFVFSISMDVVAASTIVQYDGQYLLAELVGTEGVWNTFTTIVAQLSDIPEIPEKLPNPNALKINDTSYDGSAAVDITIPDTKVVRAAFTYYAENPVTGIESVTCDITPSELAGYMANKTVIAELTDEDGTYIGSAVFGKTGALFAKAVADIVTTKGIYRITADSQNAGYSVDFLQLTASDGGIIIFEEKTISSSVVNNLAFQLDTIYDIYWNGILYTCTSYSSEGEVYTGNGSIINSNLPDTGEPFLFTHLAGASSCLLHKASGQASSNTLMVATHGYKVAGDGTSIDVTAEVGQTIVVKSVDENGKPTEWEAAEYPVGAKIYSRVEIESMTYEEFTEEYYKHPIILRLDNVDGEDWHTDILLTKSGTSIGGCGFSRRGGEAIHVYANSTYDTLSLDVRRYYIPTISAGGSEQGFLYQESPGNFYIKQNSPARIVVSGDQLIDGATITVPSSEYETFLDQLAATGDVIFIDESTMSLANLLTLTVSEDNSLSIKCISPTTGNIITVKVMAGE